MTDVPNTQPAPVGIAIAGPFGLGAAVGVPLGFAQIAKESVLLPALVLGIGILMLPSLYIALSLAGVAPPARDVARVVVESLRIIGIATAGLTLPVAFLASTTTSPGFAIAIGLVSVAMSAILGLRVVYLGLGQAAEHRGRVLAVLAVWSLVTLGLGAHGFISTLTT